MEENTSINSPSPEGNIPPPQNEGATIRTMKSDIDSVSKTGGGIPEAEPLNPFIETDESIPVFNPETTTPNVSANPSVLSTHSQSHAGVRMWLVWLLVSVIVLALLVAGYVYALPLIFPRTPELPPVTNQQPPVDTEVTPSVVTPAHQSVFGYPLESPLVSQVSIDNYNVVSIVSALQDASENVPTEGSLREVVIVTSQGKPARFSEYIPALLPALEKSDLVSLLASAYNDDFTTFLYYDADGVWPGYIVRKTNATIPIDLPLLSELERAEIFNFLLTPPTGETLVFKNGQVQNRFNTRYATFARKPAAFNYGLFGEYLILSTSYQGLLKVVDTLQL